MLNQEKRFHKNITRNECLYIQIELVEGWGGERALSSLLSSERPIIFGISLDELLLPFNVSLSSATVYIYGGRLDASNKWTL